MDTAAANVIAQQLDNTVKWLDHARSRHLLDALSGELRTMQRAVEEAGAQAYASRLAFYMDNSGALLDTLRIGRGVLDDAISHCPDPRIRLGCSAAMLQLVKLDDAWQRFARAVRQPPDLTPGA